MREKEHATASDSTSYATSLARKILPAARGRDPRPAGRRKAKRLYRSSFSCSIFVLAWSTRTMKSSQESSKFSHAFAFGLPTLPLTFPSPSQRGHRRTAFGCGLKPRWAGISPVRAQTGAGGTSSRNGENPTPNFFVARLQPPSCSCTLRAFDLSAASSMARRQSAIGSTSLMKARRSSRLVATSRIASSKTFP